MLSLTLDPHALTLDPHASGADRLAAWQDVMSATGVVHVADPDALAGTLRSHELGPLRTIRITASTFRLVRDQVRAAAVAREHVLVNLVEAGGFEGRLAGRRLLAGPGDLVLSRLGNLMDVVLHDADWLALVVLQRLVEQHMCALPDPLPPREVGRATRSALATLAACLGEAAASRRAAEDQEEVTARSVRRFIVRRLSDPALDVEMIQRAFGLPDGTRITLTGVTGLSVSSFV